MRLFVGLPLFGMGLPLFPVGLLFFARWESWTCFWNPSKSSVYIYIFFFFIRYDIYLKFVYFQLQIRAEKQFAVSKQVIFTNATIEVFRNPSYPDITSGVCSRNLYETVSTNTLLFNITASDSDGVSIMDKVNWYTSRGDNHQNCFLSLQEKKKTGSTLKGKNLLPRGANYFLLK